MAVGPPPPPHRRAADYPDFSLRQMAAKMRIQAKTFEAWADDLEAVADRYHASGAGPDDAIV
jgi:hypothetical protein